MKKLNAKTKNIWGTSREQRIVNRKADKKRKQNKRITNGRRFQ